MDTTPYISIATMLLGFGLYLWAFRPATTQLKDDAMFGLWANVVLHSLSIILVAGSLVFVGLAISFMAIEPLQMKQMILGVWGAFTILFILGAVVLAFRYVSMETDI